MTANIARPVDYWTLNASGLTSVASHWSDGVPVVGAAVVIDPTGQGVVVTMDSAGFTLSTLTMQNATGVLQGGNLSVTTGAALQGVTLLGPHAMTVNGTSQIGTMTLGGGITLYNKGVLTQSTGVLDIGISATSTAKVVNLAGATWLDEDTVGVLQGGGTWFINYGTFTATSGAYSLTTVHANFLSSGTVSVAPEGTLALTTTQVRLSGAISGGGRVDYQATLATLGALSVAATNQTNLSLVNQIGTMTLTGAQGLVNRGKWYLGGDVSILPADNSSMSLVSVATAIFAKTAGTGVSVIGIDATLEGAVRVAAGTLDFAGASNIFTGPISGAGTFEISAGSSVLQTTSLSVAQFTLAGGVTTVLGAETYAGAFQSDSGATLTFGGNGSALTLTGTVALSGLNVDGSGSLSLDSYTPALGYETMNLSGLTIGGTAQVIDESDVIQSGDVTLGDANVADAADLTIGEGGGWAAWSVGTSNILSGADPASILTIGSNAVLDKNSAGISIVAPSVVNNGVNIPAGSGGYQPRGINDFGGTIDFKGAVGGTGSLNIDGTGANYVTETTLKFDSSVGAGQNVVFSGVGAALYLTDLPDFHASITGFDTTSSTDSLLFGGNIVALGGAVETATSATLTLLDVNHSAHTLTLTGDYVGKSFTGFSSGGVLRVT